MLVSKGAFPAVGALLKKSKASVVTMSDVERASTETGIQKQEIVELLQKRKVRMR